MATLSTSIKLDVVTSLINALDLGNVRNDQTYTKTISWATGTGANQADMLFHDQRTLASTIAEDIDLAGALTGPLGNTLTFARVKAIVIFAATANTTSLTVSRNATTGAPFLSADGDAFVLTPGGLFVLTNPSATAIAVTATTDDTINIANGSGANATYDIIVIGASA